MSRQLFEALHEIGDRIVQTSHLLLCLDFDGTLTPFVDHPNDVDLADDTRRVLRSLSQLEAVSPAVFSGRSFADLQECIHVPGVICAGNHGLEIGGPGLYFVEPTAGMFRESVKELAADLVLRLKAIPEAFVEEKGLTLSVHYRRVPGSQRDAVRRLVQVALANASHPFLLNAGSMVFEIQPRVYWTKSNAVTWLRQHLGEDDLLTIYLGGDFTDEDVFLSLHDAVTIEVGDAPGTAALFYLEGPEEVHAFLEWVFNRVREKTLATGALRNADLTRNRNFGSGGEANHARIVKPSARP
jgi:trehalose 6-phosphate phosphatase